MLTPAWSAKLLLTSAVLGQMAWQMGSPMSQTLFTSLYLDRLLWPEPKSLDDAHFSRLAAADGGNPYLHLILRAYCLALIKCCHFVHERIAFEQTCYEVRPLIWHGGKPR